MNTIAQPTEPHVMTTYGRVPVGPDHAFDGLAVNDDRLAVDRDVVATDLDAIECKDIHDWSRMAGDQGFEPQLTESESAVLPLN